MGVMLYNAFIDPLMQMYAGIYESLPYSLKEGGRIIIFALILNFLLMPVYAQMDRKSRAGRALHERVAAEVARIKKHFRGRERYYYVRTVHRQFGYRPLSHLLSSADLFVQVLVFATVYRFMSGLPALEGAAYGPLSDLSRPDQLLAGVNVLPLIMTAINAATVFAYVQNRSRRIQAWCLAVLFFVLLYGSPSGLVLYWTTNNVFSLARALVQRQSALRAPGKWAERFAKAQGQV